MGYKAICRFKKLPTRGNVGGSGDHNFRGRKTLNADPARLHLNEHTGATSTAELFAAMDARIAELDEVDPQAVPLVEMLVTAAHGAFQEGGGAIDSAAYFDDAVRWAEEKFGKQNVIATTRHYDELTPHLVVYFVPVREVEASTRKRSVIVGKDAETGKQIRETREYPMPARSILSAKHWLDGRQKLSNLQTEFAAKVGAKHGLERGVMGSRARHVTVQQFYRNLQQPVVPIPKPPKIEGMMNWLKTNELLAEYEQRLGAALVPLQARARDRDNHAEHRSDPADRARAEAAEALNERNAKQIAHMQALLLDAEAQVATGNDQIAQLQAEIDRLTAELAEWRRLADAQQAEIDRLRSGDDEYVNLDIDPLAPR
jgi:uncharacterized small protein (DUF1192 family)